MIDLREPEEFVRADGAERGFTLLELLVAMAVLAIIMTPLVFSLISGLRNTRTAEQLIGESRSAQMITSLWTRDVQNVDPDGVNTRGECSREEPSGLPEETLVTFSWGASPTADQPESATWVVVGTGTNAKLERRGCVRDEPKTVQVVADSFGLSKEDPSQVVRGPDTADPRQFCPVEVFNGTENVGKTCTIVVDGSYSYSLTVGRRTPDLADATPPMTPPRAPEITLAVPRNQQINVAWEPADSTATSPASIAYRVFLYDSMTGEAIGSHQSEDLVHSFTGLMNGQQYWIRVQAANEVGWGPLSAPAGPITPSSTTPEPPTVATAIPGDTDIEVTWTPNPNDGGAGVTSWQLYAVNEGGNTLAEHTVLSTGASTEVAVFPGLDNGETYRIRVAGENVHGIGPRSEASAAVVPYGVPGDAGITSVTSLADGKIRIEWRGPEGAENLPEGAAPGVFDGGRDIAGYSVHVNEGPSSGPWPSSGYVAKTPNDDSYVLILDGLSLGQAYRFEVRTHNERGFSTSAPSDQVIPLSEPGAVANLELTMEGHGTGVVTWGPPADLGGTMAVEEYEIRWEVATSGASLPSPNPRQVAGSVQSVTENGLSVPASYTVYVRARTAAGWGPETAASKASVGRPTVPSVTVSRPATVITQQLQVTIPTAPLANGHTITSLKVRCTVGSTPTDHPISSPSSYPATVVVSGLQDGVDQKCALVAVNSAGESAGAQASAVKPYGECVLRPSGDTFTRAGDKSGNYSTQTFLEVKQGSDERRTYLKWDFTSPCDQKNGGEMMGTDATGSDVDVQSASLSLWQIGSGYGSVGCGAVWLQSCYLDYIMRTMPQPNGGWVPSSIKYDDVQGNYGAALSSGRSNQHNNQWTVSGLTQHVQDMIDTNACLQNSSICGSTIGSRTKQVGIAIYQNGNRGSNQWAHFASLENNDGIDGNNPLGKQPRLEIRFHRK